METITAFFVDIGETWPMMTPLGIAANFGLAVVATIGFAVTSGVERVGIMHFLCSWAAVGLVKPILIAMSVGPEALQGENQWQALLVDFKSSKLLLSGTINFALATGGCLFWEMARMDKVEKKPAKRTMAELREHFKTDPSNGGNDVKPSSRGQKLFGE